MTIILPTALSPSRSAPQSEPSNEPVEEMEAGAVFASLLGIGLPQTPTDGPTDAAQAGSEGIQSHTVPADAKSPIPWTVTQRAGVEVPGKHAPSADIIPGAGSGNAADVASGNPSADTNSGDASPGATASVLAGHPVATAVLAVRATANAVAANPTTTRSAMDPPQTSEGPSLSEPAQEAAVVAGQKADTGANQLKFSLIHPTAESAPQAQRPEILTLRDLGSGDPAANIDQRPNILAETDLSGGHHPQNDGGSILPSTPVQLPVSGTGPAPSMPLAPHLAESAWTQFAHSVTHHVQQSPRPLRAIQFELDPPELGPLIVRFHDHGDRITAHVVAQHDHTRWLVESHAGQIRDVLAHSGIALETHTWSHSDSPGGNPTHDFGGRPMAPQLSSKGILAVTESQVSGTSASAHAVNLLV